MQINRKAPEETRDTLNMRSLVLDNLKSKGIICALAKEVALQLCAYTQRRFATKTALLDGTMLLAY